MTTPLAPAFAPNCCAARALALLALPVVAACTPDALTSVEPSPTPLVAVRDTMGVITGIVVDARGQPLASVGVSVTGTTRGAITNAAGEFRVQVPPGTHRLQVRRIGLHAMSVDGVRVPAGGEMTLGTHLVLEAKTMGCILEGVVIPSLPLPFSTSPVSGRR